MNGSNNQVFVLSIERKVGTGFMNTPINLSINSMFITIISL